MDRSHDRSQCNSSDRRSTPRMTNVYKSTNRSSFISHDKSSLTYHDGNIENSLNLVTSDDKRGHGTAAPDYSLHRNVKRNGSNRSRNSPPVYLALKSHREFVDIDRTEVGSIDSTTKEEKLQRSHNPQQSVENAQITTEDVEQLTGLFCKHVAVCGEG
ncbi:unnamed protein product [Cercopithifilaria johnstoni]|uniref:Uncharacterized protein n=1 Tax=Cercopithifilaria johnstoni TaxID=2874296 RepID=A0A8J2MJA4_9BILA|nr:unnamed protein product [Cercopithifilaria johnstoni]